MPPIVIAGAIAAGGALAGSALTSHAASKAAQGQADAARRAQAFNERVYAEQKQRMAPYEALGTNAMQRYGSYMQQPFNQRLASLGQPYNPRTAPNNPYALGPQPQAPQGSPMMSGGTATGPSGFGFGQGGVRVQSPEDGSVRMVPPELVDRLVAKGGRVVQ